MTTPKILPRKRPADCRGFTLIEIIVILAVLAILVATLTPVVLKYIADAQLTRAKNDVTQIATAFNGVIQDTGQYPGPLADADFLCGPGTLATAGATGWAANLVGAKATSCTLTGNTAPAGSSLAGHLIVNNPNEDVTIAGAGDYKSPASGNRWRGPYVQSLNEDPWGNAYQVNALNFTSSSALPTWVMSAGPDGTFQTSITATTIASGSDDIGIRIK